MIYYPPYQSKYNPVERCWAALEQFWNGAIFDSVETTLAWASHMMWKGFDPMVYHLTSTYEKGITVDSETSARVSSSLASLRRLAKVGYHYPFQITGDLLGCFSLTSVNENPPMISTTFEVQVIYQVTDDHLISLD